MIAALFVEHNGHYIGLPGVDAWPKQRDARKYCGPWPVLTHSPCERWGIMARRNGRIGEDEGCAEAAIKFVRKYSGIFEHPMNSLAFKHFGLPLPSSKTGWSEPDRFGGRSCLVYQGHYGHRAPKPTWLYGVGIDFKELKWGKTPTRDLSHLDKKTRARVIRTGICQNLSHRQRRITPEGFRDLLISMLPLGKQST